MPSVGGCRWLPRNLRTCCNSSARIDELLRREHDGTTVASSVPMTKAPSMVNL